MILLARTTALEDVKRPSEGLSLFYIDLDTSAPGLELKRIAKMGGRYDFYIHQSHAVI
jgi:acyl-CoA dehydrogenase